jgi:hypothetical protein
MVQGLIVPPAHFDSAKLHFCISPPADTPSNPRNRRN